VKNDRILGFAYFVLLHTLEILSFKYVLAKLEKKKHFLDLLNLEVEKRDQLFT